EVLAGLHPVSEALRRQAAAAIARGEAIADLTLHLPVGAAAAGEAFLDVLDQIARRLDAAAYPFALPAEERLLWRWCVGSITDQLTAAAARGTPADPPIRFHEALVQELRGLDGLRRAAERKASLHRVAAAVAAAQTPQEVAMVVVVQGAEALQASGAALLVR